MAEDVEGGVKVELDIFSGKQNPFWRLAPKQAKSLMDEIARLPSVSNNTEDFPGLGFRGFLLTLREASAPTVRVYHGKIIEGGVERLDVDRKVEQKLRASAPQKILSEFGSEIR